MTIRQHIAEYSAKHFFQLPSQLKPLRKPGEVVYGNKEILDKEFVSRKFVKKNNLSYIFYFFEDGSSARYEPDKQFGPGIYYPSPLDAFLSWMPNSSPVEEESWQKEYFDAMTDGQHGDYYDFEENGGDIDDLEDRI